MGARTDLGKGIHVGVGAVGDGGVRLGDGFQGFGVAFQVAGRQRDFGGLGLDLVRGGRVMVPVVERQLLFPLGDFFRKHFHGLAQQDLHFDGDLLSWAQSILELNLPGGKIFGLRQLRLTDPQIGFVRGSRLAGGRKNTIE